MSVELNTHMSALGNEKKSVITTGNEAQLHVIDIFNRISVQRNLRYSADTITRMLPVTVAYYLFWKAALLMQESEDISQARPHVATALHIYPALLEEIVVEHSHTRSLSLADPHDVGQYLGVRLAGIESLYGKSSSIMKAMRQEVVYLRNLMTQGEEDSKAS